MRHDISAQHLSPSKAKVATRPPIDWQDQQWHFPGCDDELVRQASAVEIRITDCVPALSSIP